MYDIQTELLAVNVLFSDFKSLTCNNTNLSMIVTGMTFTES